MTIAERRKRLGWSQQRLAERAGVSVRTITNIEAGRVKPYELTTNAIEAALKEGERGDDG